MEREKQIKVFYSWQSDLPISTNRNLIRAALRAASSLLEAELLDQGVNIVVDEATRNCPGSPDIPATILNKIEDADIFVCDISTINYDAPDGRRVPNPNVMLELGYSIANLGWARIIIIFNETYGSHDDIPFDISRNRCFKYKATTEKSDYKQYLSKLTKFMFDALKEIINQNPEKNGNSTFDPELRKREHDINVIVKILKTLHIPTIDALIEESPYKINKENFYFYEGFKAQIKSTLFFIYDGELLNYIVGIYNSWDAILSESKCYSATPSGDYIFYNPLDLPLRDDQEESWKNIEKARAELNKNIRGLITYIREKYLEVDLERYSKEAWIDYIEFHKDV